MAGQTGLPIDLVVKFGGSAITDKCQLETLKQDNLASAADVIKTCVERRLRCVVIHGAGSFGHHQAKEYQVNNGLRGTTDEVKKRRHGMCLTRLSVTKLNHMVVQSLVDKNINAIGLPTENSHQLTVKQCHHQRYIYDVISVVTSQWPNAAGSWLMDNGQVSRHGVTSVMEILDSGFVPVLHGDCVLDSSKGCIILSGDVIIKTICKEQKVNRVVFLSDVAGVYNKPPSHTEAEHISKICVTQDRRISTDMSTSASQDRKVKDISTSESQDRKVTDISTSESQDRKVKDISTSESQDRKVTDISTSESQYDVTGGMMLKIQTAMDIVINSSGLTKVYITKVGSDCVNQICEGRDTGQYNTKLFTEIIYHQ